jgi:hypothetical protein
MNPISYSGISPYLRPSMPSLPSLFLTANNSLQKKFGAKSLRLKILLLKHVNPKISGANHAKPIVFKDSRGEGTRIIRLQAAAFASRYASDTTGTRASLRRHCFLSRFDQASHGCFYQAWNKLVELHEQMIAPGNNDLPLSFQVPL